MLAIIICLLFNLPLVSTTGGIYDDPTLLGIGARTIGMGRAYTAVADDIHAIFYNPSALIKIRGPQVMSMSTSILGDINYLTAAGAMPTRWGVFGLSYVGRSISGVNIQDYQSGRVSFTSGTSGYWGDFALGLTHARDLGRWPGIGLLSVGGTLKLLSASMGGVSNSNLGNSSGFGMDLDLGLLFEPSDELSVGLHLIDILPSNWGGNVKFGSTEESLPAYMVLGFGYILNDQVKLAIDFEHSYALARPLLYRIGAQYQLMPSLVVRGGLDQSSAIGSNGGIGRVETAVSLGLGMHFNEFMFDYAYKPYTTFAANIAHYFSLSWYGEVERMSLESAINISKAMPGQIVIVSSKILGRLPISSVVVKYPDQSNKTMVYNEREKLWESFWIVPDALKDGTYSIPISAKDTRRAVANTRLEGLSIVNEFNVDKPNLVCTEPKLNTVTDKDVIWIRGNVENADKLYIDNNRISVDKDGNFEVAVPLETGKNSLLLAAFNSFGQSVEKHFKVLRLSSFKDIREDNPYITEIKYLATIGLIGGFPDLSFKPKEGINRAAFATILTKLDGGEISAKTTPAPYYNDVPAEHWAAQYIDYATKAGFISGFPKKMFMGKLPVSKVQSIVALTKLDKLVIPSEVTEQTFADVPLKHWGASFVAAASKSGMLNNVPESYLNPNADLTRDEMALFISRTLKGRSLINDLLDFNQGYEIHKRPEYKAEIAKVKQLPQSIAKIEILQPVPSSMIYTERLLLKGLAEDTRMVIVNNDIVHFQSDGTFYHWFEMPELGTFELHTMAVDKHGNKLDDYRKILRMPYYRDVTDLPARYLYEFYGLIVKDSRSGFGEEEWISRADAVKALALAFNLPLSNVDEDLFLDVSKDHPQAREIKSLVKESVITDWSETFRPNDPVSRREAAVWLNILMNRQVSLGQLKDVNDIKLDGVFTDVSSDDLAYKAIKKLLNWKIILPEAQFAPDYLVSRGSFAKWIMNIASVKSRVKEIARWVDPKGDLESEIYKDIAINEPVEVTSPVSVEKPVIPQQKLSELEADLKLTPEKPVAGTQLQLEIQPYDLEVSKLSVVFLEEIKEVLPSQSGKWTSSITIPADTKAGTYLLKIYADLGNGTIGVKSVPIQVIGKYSEVRLW